jgi:thermostable 8-oxoguanine DNA glycosylase
MQTIFHNLSDQKLKQIYDKVIWYRNASKVAKSKVLPHPEFGRWKKWDDDRVFCSIFFCIAARNNSIAARDYLDPIEKGDLKFELKVSDLMPLSDNERIRLIWEFGTGNNRNKARLGIYFSQPHKVNNVGKYPKTRNNYERVIAETFKLFAERGFIDCLIDIDRHHKQRDKANIVAALIPMGVKQKVSRDFLNDVGMTDSLIALDRHVMAELKEIWGWDVRDGTPPNKAEYDEIEDAVRSVAGHLGVTVLEIDKSIYFSRMTREFE